MDASLKQLRAEDFNVRDNGVTRLSPPAPEHSNWPALLAAMTDPTGAITGIQCSWLDRARPFR